MNMTATVASAQLAVPHSTNTITLQLPTPFVPVAPKGGHDLYHCSLLNPNVTTDQMITDVKWAPGQIREDHHAILYWVSPSDAASATAMDHGGQGWTCFGGTGVGSHGSEADNWLAGWGPGHNESLEPTGTGVPLLAGSLIVMQMHYNLLAGHWPDQTKVTLTTVNAAGSGLIPLNLNLFAAPPDTACPAGTHGTLCSKTASLNDIGRRFGVGLENFDKGLEYYCYNNLNHVGNSSSCTYTVPQNEYIWNVTPHMHLLGVAMTVTLNPSSSPKVLVNNTNYDFHLQTSFAEPKPVFAKKGDRIRVSCTFNPVLRSQLPFLKSLPPRFVVWGDGSSDEMCLSIVGFTTVLPSGVTAATYRPNMIPSAPTFPAALLRTVARFSGSKVPTMAALTDGSMGTSTKLTRLQKLLLEIGVCG